VFCPQCGKEVSGSPAFCPSCDVKLTKGIQLTKVKPKEETRPPQAAASPSAQRAVIPPAQVTVPPSTQVVVSPKSRLATTLLAFFLGAWGGHRFYLGKIGTAITMLVLLILGWATLSIIVGIVSFVVVFIWWIIDFLLAVSGNMKDKDGLPIKNW
jgi:TM2 domain-containing membrane protein YozV